MSVGGISANAVETRQTAKPMQRAVNSFVTLDECIFGYSPEASVRDNDDDPRAESSNLQFESKRGGEVHRPTRVILMRKHSGGELRSSAGPITGGRASSRLCPLPAYITPS